MEVKRAQTRSHSRKFARIQQQQQMQTTTTPSEQQPQALLDAIPACVLVHSVLIHLEARDLCAWSQSCTTARTLVTVGGDDARVS